MVGIREIEKQIRLVSFLEYDLGRFDEARPQGERRRRESIEPS
jgi:hypothetical protein